MRAIQIRDQCLRQKAPARWSESCVNDECTLHQLSPYIGKIKSSIAGELVTSYSVPGDIVVDPFAGAGTIPFEAAIRGRIPFAADISPYARVLSQAKLSPPKTLEIALQTAEKALFKAQSIDAPSLSSVPRWVKRFFHPRTLLEALKFASVARRSGNEFLMACFLGILHHQRPGFLSYPSSHLVPYLRDKKFPRARYPEMYDYRPLKPRLFAKIRRAYKRFRYPDTSPVSVFQTSIEAINLPTHFDALITSPPYMNALDYARDNRLRLWFIDPRLPEAVGENDIIERRQAFVSAITSLSKKIIGGLKHEGYCILVVGEEVHRSFSAHPADVIVSIFRQHARCLHLKRIVTDSIPDIRRTRRECRGVKTEHILVFQRS